MKSTPTSIPFPDEWTVRPLGEIFDFYPTATNSRSELSDDGDTFYIHYGDIHTKFYGHLDLEKNSAPRIDRSRCRNATLLKNGDWIIADASEDFDGVGMSIEVSGIENGKKAISGLHTFLLREKSKTYAPGFKGYLGSSSDLRKQYMRVMTGMKVFGVTKAALREIFLPIPSIIEQEFIVEVLSDANALICELEKLITKKRLIKQGVLQDLLSGERRLPGFSDEWNEKTFGEIFDFYSTVMNSRNELDEDGDTFYIHYGDIHTKFRTHLNFGKTTVPRIDRNLCKNATLLENGDWVMVTASEDSSGVGKSVEVSGLKHGQQAVSGMETFLLREKRSTYVPGIKGHISNSPSLRKQYMRVMKGMKVLRFSKSDLSNLVLPIPGIDEQTAITSVLSSMDEEISIIEKKIAKFRQIKRAITQDLLTGRVRLV